MATIPLFELSVNLADGSGLTKTARANRDALIKAYRARLDGDAQALLSLLHPQVRFYDSSQLPYGREYRGLNGVVEGIKQLFSFWEKTEIEMTEFLAGGDLVMAYLQFRATTRDTGQLFDSPGGALYRFVDGKIIEWRTFFWNVHLIHEIFVRQQHPPVGAVGAMPAEAHLPH